MKVYLNIFNFYTLLANHVFYHTWPNNKSISESQGTSPVIAGSLRDEYWNALWGYSKV